MIRFAAGIALFIVLLLIWLPARADTTCKGKSPSRAELRATQHPGAVAELFFDNTGRDNTEDVACVLWLGGMAVMVDLVLGRGNDPDTVNVSPPPGYVAVPETSTIKDDRSDLILIYPEHSLIAF